ncbi:MAG: hypothetical protein DMG87_02560 [Acidobacteria bacterium]|nr:MAG: hypothetical protein DMG87_02560 [Acidobacteriota bacterium]
MTANPWTPDWSSTTEASRSAGVSPAVRQASRLPPDTLETGARIDTAVSNISLYCAMDQCAAVAESFSRAIIAAISAGVAGRIRSFKASSSRLLEGCQLKSHKPVASS